MKRLSRGNKYLPFITSPRFLRRAPHLAPPQYVPDLSRRQGPSRRPPAYALHVLHVASCDAVITVPPSRVHATSNTTSACPPPPGPPPPSDADADDATAAANVPPLDGVTRATPPQHALAIAPPSGLHATLFTSPPPSIVATHAPVRRSQTRAVPSSDPDATYVPPGRKSTPTTSSACPASVETHANEPLLALPAVFVPGARVSQSLTVPSNDAVAMTSACAPPLAPGPNRAPYT